MQNAEHIGVAMSVDISLSQLKAQPILPCIGLFAKAFNQLHFQIIAPKLAMLSFYLLLPMAISSMQCCQPYNASGRSMNFWTLEAHHRQTKTD